MKQFFTFINKEFLHVLRDRKTLLILFGMPVVQILIFGFALTNEVKNSKIVVVDYAKDVASKEIINKIEASRYFEIDHILSGTNELETAFKTGKIKMAVVFPENFNSNLLHQNKAQIQIIADASDPNQATTLTNYVLELPIKGNLFLLFSESILFIITCLTLGIFISVKTDSMQTAMLLSLMGMLLPTLLFSGFMFPVENMPIPLQIFSNIVPAKWYYIIVKRIMIEGLGFAAVWKETLILIGTTIFLLFISLKSFKIRMS
jgi:hypothetical protein